MVNRVKVQNDAELKDRLVAINRVTKVTKGGRTFTFALLRLLRVVVHSHSLPSLL